jgi:hypothetical protein
MRLRVYLFAVLATLGLSSPVWAQESGRSTSTVAGAPWVGSRAIGEGAGIRTGNVEWHPGISGEFGYDSNYLQRANSTVDETNYGPVIPSLRLRVTPQLSLRSVDRDAESGKERGAPPTVMFDVSAAGSYNEFVPLGGPDPAAFRKLRNFQGGVGAVLDILPQRKWSGQVRGSYSYIAEPSNQVGLASQFDRHTIGGGGKIAWAPGGGAFRWTLVDYMTRVTIFDDGAFGVYDNGNHAFQTLGHWKFLPKTSVLYDGKLSVIRYSDNRAINDGEALEGRIGLNGLLTTKLSLLVMGGWAASFYRDQIGLVRNYDSWIGRAEAKWFFSPEGRLQDGSADVGASALAVGALRDFNDSYLGDFYRRHRVYGQMSYLIGGRVITTIEGGYSRINYPDFLFTGIEQAGFGEDRIDVQGFVEYRPVTTVGINLQVRYDQNISKTITADTFEDDLSFNRFRAMLGARWFL